MSGRPPGRPRNSLGKLVESGEWSWTNRRHRALLELEDLPEGADKQLRDLQAWYRVRSQGGGGRCVDEAQLFGARVQELAG
jgi:hypothetical protein